MTHLENTAFKHARSQEFKPVGLLIKNVEYVVSLAPLQWDLRHLYPDVRLDARARKRRMILQTHADPGNRQIRPECVDVESLLIHDSGHRCSPLSTG